MGHKILLDTDIVIWLLKNSSEHVDTFLREQEAGSSFLLSPIVSAEIYTGAFKKEYPIIQTLFSWFVPLTLDTATGKIAGEYAYSYKRSHNKISLEDYFLAASAKQEKALLWTNNYKHYPMTDIKFYANRSLEV